MKVKSLVIVGIVSLIAVIILIVLTLLIVHLNNNSEKINIEENIETSNITVPEQEDVLVVGLDNDEEETQEEPISVKDPATLTQEVYDINGPIGTLNIPKTGLNTQVYSNVTVDRMEVMPCFLYTTGGINEVGTTLFVGHNRANGLLFSNNNMLEENDEFHFTDLNGVEKKYTVFSKFVTDNDDVSFYNNKVDSPVIAMQCCLTPDNEEQVIIVMGRAES